MSAGSGSGQGAARPARTPAGNAVFAAGLVLVLALMTLGAYLGVMLAGWLADSSFLSSAVPDDGRGAVMVGGIGLGGLTGLFVPTVVFGMVRGSDDTPRLGPGEAARKVLALLVFDVLLVVVALVAAQLGWLLPKGPTTLISVFLVGFSWMPLALVPWERFGLTSFGGLGIGPSGAPTQNAGSQQAE